MLCLNLVSSGCRLSLTHEYLLMLLHLSHKIMVLRCLNKPSLWRRPVEGGAHFRRQRTMPYCTQSIDVLLVLLIVLPYALGWAAETSWPLRRTIRNSFPFVSLLIGALWSYLELVASRSHILIIGSSPAIFKYEKISIARWKIIRIWIFYKNIKSISIMGTFPYLVLTLSMNPHSWLRWLPHHGCLRVLAYLLRWGNRSLAAMRLLVYDSIGSYPILSSMVQAC